ncbi:MAG: GNAT family N-acetyltransferase [Actinomycetota bacterium]
MVSVRRATLDDLEAMVGAYTAAWREGFRYMFSASVFADHTFDDERREECHDAVLGDDCDTYVAEVCDRVVGFAVASTSAERAIDLDDIWIHPSAWGSGAAAALVTRIEEDLRASGGGEVIAWIPEDSPSGRRFFDKLGWRPTGTVEWLALYPEQPNRLFEYGHRVA